MAEGENKEEAAPPQKGGKGKLFVILLAPALLAGAGVAGAMFGPKLLGKQDIAPEPVASAAAAGPDVPLGITVEMKPIVVDLRDKESGVHHIKLTLAVELKDQTPQEDFDKLQPRARESAIAFLRTKEFEAVTDPKAFDALRKDIGETIVKAVGEKVVARVLVVDFVAQ